MVRKINIKTKDRRPKTEDSNFLKVFSLWSLVFSLFLCGCTKTLYKEKFVVIGTYLEVISPDKNAGNIAYQEFKRLEGILNFYDSNSELSRLNKTYGTPFKASRELIEILELSRQMNELTKGAFDISYGALYDYWKKRIKEKNITQLPAKEEIEIIKQLCGMDNIAIDKEAQTVLIKKPGLKIDLGAIAKGYIVDKAVAKLKEAGITSALINAGGQIHCLGLNNGIPWRIGIKNPENLKGVIDQEILIDESIATSGGYEQFFKIGNKTYSHLIDPRTGYPVENNLTSVSVISKNGTTCDGLSTGFFVLGLDGIRQFLAMNKSTMRIFVVTKDDNGVRTQIFR